MAVRGSLKRGSWAWRSRRIIEDAGALANATKPGLDRTELRALINEQYPFGQRELLPYKMWLRELKRYLDRRFGKPPVPNPRVVPWPDRVACDWCGGAGCLVCGSVSLPPVSVREEWLAVRENAPPGIQADWLEERGVCRRGGVRAGGGGAVSVQDVLKGGRKWWCQQGDAVEFLRSLPGGAVSLVMCSPPYELARLYLENGEDMGIARGTEEWAAWMVEVCEAARYACAGLCAFVVEGQTKNYRYSCSPFLLMADLHRRGFHLRKPAVYQRVGIPGSGGPDWLRNDWEPVVCFTSGGRLPWSENTAMGNAPKWKPGGEPSYRTEDGSRVSRRKAARDAGYRMKISTSGKRDGDTISGEATYIPPDIANPGNIIHCKTGGGQMGETWLCHDNEAPYPERLAEFFIRSFCPSGGVVCDPFSGSGTTAAVAVRWGRRFVGCDLRQSQVDLTRKRVETETPLALFPEEPDA